MSVPPAKVNHLRTCGRKRLMDEDDEQYLAKCITEKSTAHGRRKDLVPYLNHRVKKQDFLRIINYNRVRRKLPLLKSTTAIYNSALSKTNVPDKQNITLDFAGFASRSLQKHHMTWQFLEICYLSITDELLVSFVRNCKRATKWPL